MSGPKIGGLCFGYGGLDLAVQSVIPDAELAWYAEFDKGASKIGAHRFPGVPNHGDMTAIDWAAVEPVDIITGGTPCQDLSHAGKRKGMTEGTRSNLWVAMREAIATIKPRLVVWENVGGAFSAAADSEVESCPGCVGDGPGVHLRALQRVLGDLASLGFDAEWHALRASDVGAPHGRLRVFVVASPADAGSLGRHGRQVQLGGRSGQPAGDSSGTSTLLPTPRTSDTNGAGRHGAGGLDLRTAVHGLLPTPRATRGGSNTETVDLLPTPRATDGTKGGPNQRGSSGDLMLPSAVTLLPTPAVNDDMGEGKTVEARDEWTAKMQAAHGNGNGHGASLAIEAQRLLPTPVYSEARKANWEPSQKRIDGGHEVYLTNALHDRHGQDWGIYADAIARWESLTRPAPAPTQPSKKGTPQLAPAFSEWMMGLPAGWVTDVPGITRNEALKALGNGVVPQQAAAALRIMLAAQEVSA